MSGTRSLGTNYERPMLHCELRRPQADAARPRSLRTLSTTEPLHPSLALFHARQGGHHSLTPFFLIPLPLFLMPFLPFYFALRSQSV